MKTALLAFTLFVTCFVAVDIAFNWKHIPGPAHITHYLTGDQQSCLRDGAPLWAADACFTPGMGH